MSATPPAAATPDPARWKALFFIALAQLMIALDVTVVNIALPSAQHGLHMSDADRQWIIAAYTLAFGGLLLFGGRVADLVGRKRTFLIGLAGFAVASAAGGAAGNGAVLITARALQGVCGALLAPSALALITVAFADVAERARAIGVYSAIASGGGAIGLVLGGVLTEYLNWRWSLYISVPIAMVAGAGALAVVHDPPGGRARGGLDVPGAVLSTAGLTALVCAFAVAETEGWTAGITIGLFTAAVALLAGFVLVEAKVPAPLLPLGVIADRARGGANLALCLSVMSMYGMFLFVTYYLQTVRGFSPVATGMAFLPMAVCLGIGSTQIAGRLPNAAPRTVMGWGFAAAAAGVLLLTRLTVDSGYARLVLPAGILLGLGLGAAFVPAVNVATSGVRPRDAGIASAVSVAVQQLGGSIGTVLLNSVAAGAAARYATAHPAPAGPPGDRMRHEAMVHGFASSSWWATGVLVLAVLITVVLVTGAAGAGRRHEVPGPGRANSRPC